MYTIINDNVFIIEIDEGQHKGYTDEDERIQKIYEELGKVNTTVIRINPDTYIDSENIKHIGIADNIDEYNKRMNIIIDTIKKTINEEQNGLKKIYLFYDKYKAVNVNTKHKFEYKINAKYERLRKIRERFVKESFIPYHNSYKI